MTRQCYLNTEKHPHSSFSLLFLAAFFLLFSLHVVLWYFIPLFVATKSEVEGERLCSIEGVHGSWPFITLLTAILLFDAFAGCFNGVRVQFC
ncbi:MAG: hypothetical protein J3Q66DRAFT_336662 [Benniella sp.]|nr:MAG: hypothetical protein J3Q66DRAFT_336662 [Benniella sp.]